MSLAASTDCRFASCSTAATISAFACSRVSPAARSRAMMLLDLGVGQRLALTLEVGLHLLEVLRLVLQHPGVGVESLLTIGQPEFAPLDLQPLLPQLGPSQPRLFVHLPPRGLRRGQHLVGLGLSIRADRFRLGLESSGPLLSALDGGGVGRMTGRRQRLPIGREVADDVGRDTCRRTVKYPMTATTRTRTNKPARTRVSKTMLRSRLRVVARTQEISQQRMTYG